ncbi:hypothetical protein PILCRDRAFT_13968 [Piloderma croceum F 1598]|uniref:Uncharacterized protein n=1 Tax=Piloderma croceum (strain F 1598) TaxID=765440 RepID=A0A0C3ER27_PILCF|nr:hypothetical protein PILCRDRAFT_13968 [Piloderma croceum F 1598]
MSSTGTTGRTAGVLTKGTGGLGRSDGMMVVVEKELQINSNLSSFLGGGLGVGTLFALHPGPDLAIHTATQAQSGSFVVRLVGSLQLWAAVYSMSYLPGLLMFTEASIGIRTSDHHCDMINSVLKLTVQRSLPLLV